MARRGRTYPSKPIIGKAVLPIVPVYAQPTRLTVQILGGTYAGLSYYLSAPLDSVVIDTTETTWTQVPAPVGFLTAANNLSDVASAATARTNLGLAIGTNVQAYDAELAALAGLTSAADQLPYFTGSGTASLTTLTSFIRTLLAAASAAAAQAVLGLSPLFPGALIPATRITTPSGFLPCDGSSVSSTTYSALADEHRYTSPLVAITNGSATLSNIVSTATLYVGMLINGPGITAGTTIAAIPGGGTTVTMSAAATATNAATPVTFSINGASNDGTTFNVIDLRGRTVIGDGTGSGLTARIMGKLIGAETHTLSTGEIPSHQHQIKGPDGTALNDYNAAGGAGVRMGGFLFTACDAALHDTEAAGGGGAHANVQPSGVAKWFVKT